MEVWKLNSQRPDAVFFIDPPYTAGGKMAGIRLYSCSELDHEELFRISNGLKGDFLMTYDSSDEIAALAHRYGLSTLLVRMKNTHHTRMNELLIGRSVDWAQPAA
jgi:DNA adenine methylase